MSDSLKACNKRLMRWPLVQLINFDIYMLLKRNTQRFTEVSSFGGMIHNYYSHFINLIKDPTMKCLMERMIYSFTTILMTQIRPVCKLILPRSRPHRLIRLIISRSHCVIPILFWNPRKENQWWFGCRPVLFYCRIWRDSRTSNWIGYISWYVDVNVGSITDTTSSIKSKRRLRK